MADNELIKFKARITYRRYYNSDTTWGTFEFSTEDDIPYFDEDKQFGNLKFCSLVGKMQELYEGAEYEVQAEYKYNEKYGHQYEPHIILALVPQSYETQLIFLKSLINESIAESLLKAYPNIVNDVVNGTLTDIDYSLVKGVQAYTWNRIKQKIIDNYVISDILMMLKPYGVTYTMIKNLLREEPNSALLKQEIDKNPYYLTKIKGLGFKKVDDLALKIKPELLESQYRLVAFVKYYFTELGDSDGHTWATLDVLKDAISNNVSECMGHFDWLLENNNYLYQDDNKIGLKYYREIELNIFNELKRKSELQMDSIKFTDEQIEVAIKEAEDKQGFTYSDEQRNLVFKVLRSNVSFITAKAGFGKTSVMRAILIAYRNNGYTMACSALSAMASKRITEATEFPAMTIHRTLEAQGFNEFLHNADNKLCDKLVFLDEGSMVNAKLFWDWLQAIGDNTHIIISGDPKQLPPIGFGNIFSDLLNTFNKDYIFELTKAMRQVEDSGILADANKVRDNINPIAETVQSKLIHGKLQDMVYMFKNEREKLFSTAIKTYLKSVETDGIDNVVIITPRRKGCLNSALEINKVIQDNLLGKEKQQITHYDITYKLGAKVMQIENNQDKNVFNGEIGYITKIYKNQNGKKIEDCCEVTFQDIVDGEKKVEYMSKELDQLDLAYANTCHKLQGSGIKTVIGIIDNTHYALLDNCMLYTMLTRAKKRCALLCEPSAFLKCIRTSSNARNTWMIYEHSKGEN